MIKFSLPGKKFLIGISLIVAVLFAPGLAKADLGPKPTMKFNLKLANDTVKVTGGEQIECQDSSCKDGKPLTKAGPQYFSCSNDSCSSLAYGYTANHKLILDVNGKKLESNVFKTKGSNSVYTVNVSENNIKVEDPLGKDVIVQGGMDFWAKVFAALLITLLIEAIILLVLKLIFKLPWKIYAPFLIANITSVPTLWFVTGWFGLTSLPNILVGEIIIVFYEALIYWLFLKDKYGYAKMLALSLALNLISFLATMFNGI